MSRFSVLVTLFLAAAPLFAAPSAYDAAREYLSLVYQGRFDGLPKTADSDTKQFEQAARNVLRVRCVRVEAALVDEAAVDGRTAALLLRVVLDKSGRIEELPLRVRLIDDGKRWLVTAVGFPDDEFAATLLAASDEESSRLLAAHPERIRASLDRAIYARAVNTFNSPGTTDTEDISRRVLRAAALMRHIAIDAGDRGGEALALGVESLDAFLERDDSAAAQRLARESLAIAGEAGDPDIFARAWYNLARAINSDPASRRPGRMHDERIDAFRRALTFAEHAEDPRLLIRSMSFLANIAVFEQSDYLGAHRYLDRLLSLTREADDPGGESDVEFELAMLYAQQSDYERAKSHCLRALQIEDRIGGRGHLLILGHYGEILAMANEPAEARKVLAQAVPIDQNGAVTWNAGTTKANASSAAAWLAGFSADEGKMDEAACLYRAAATLYDPSTPNYFMIDLAYDYMRRGEPANALRLALMSIAESPERSPRSQVAALGTLAMIYRRLGMTDRAIATALEAVELREEAESRTAGDEQEHALASELTADVYQLAAQLALDEHDVERALTLLERGRARVLTDALENGRPGAMKEAMASDEEERERREHELVRLRIDLDHARASRNRPSARRLSDQLGDARMQYATYVDGLRARSERRAATRQRVDGAELPAKIPAGVAAIEYLIEDDQIRIFVVRRNAPAICRTVRSERKTFERRVNAFVDALAARDLDIGRTSRELYDLLLRPVEAETSGAAALLIVPDGVLWRVPFAALADRHGRFAIERAAIFYAPSITAYSLMSNGKHVPRGAPTLLAIANPTIDSARASAFTSFYRGAALGPLPDAEREVDAVRALYDRKHSLVLEREQATEQRTKSAIGTASVVHFATHALLDDANPMYSRLALAEDGARADDGWLESWEIVRMNLDADLVVLSACETARGRIGGGEGVVGMAWSFFLAGAHATVATQWKIASASTATFMTAFHRSLRDGTRAAPLRKALALRDAQLKMLRDPRYGHPFYWAPFVLLGDPSGR